MTVTPDDALGDAPCPSCGTLIWPIRAEESAFLFAADEIPIAQRRRLIELLRKAEAGDSLDKVEIVMELEEFFEIDIPDREAESIRTLDDFMRFLHRRVFGDDE